MPVLKELEAMENINAEGENVGFVAGASEGEAADKVGALSEIEWLRRDNERLRREKAVYEREKSVSGSRDLFEHCGQSNQSVEYRGDGQELGTFRMGINEARTIIEEFNPSNKSVTAKDWLQSLEGLKNVYGWDDRITLFYATLRLGGAAYYWYQSKQDSIRTFGEFKENLLRSFPNGDDDASILRKIIERKRIPGEAIEDYVYQVAALARKIKLNEISTIRHLIYGLRDQNLANVLLASRCQTISDLLIQTNNYEEVQKQGCSRRNLNERTHEATGRFMSGRNSHKHASAPYMPACRWDDRRNFNEKLGMNRHKTEKGKTVTSKPRCFKCDKAGHYARNCTVDPRMKPWCDLEALNFDDGLVCEGREDEED